MSASNSSATDRSDLRRLSGLLVLVGAGKMGGALLDGWLGLGLNPANVAVVEPRPSPQIAALADRGVRLRPDTHGLNHAAAIVFAVKPQSAAEVVPAAAPIIDASTLVVSIMAGRTLQFLAGALNTGCALVRAMPNTPAAIGRGVTVAVAHGANAAQHELAHSFLRRQAPSEWVDDEALMDAVTAVSGSGPAYVFLLAETLAQRPSPPACHRLGGKTRARDRCRFRRVAPALRDDGGNAGENVTSPGGTTAAALNVLMGPNGLGSLMKEAVAAATRRSRELAG